MSISFFILSTHLREENYSIEEITRKKKDKGSNQSVDTVKETYKLPLVWIKLVTTGLNVEVDKILEIACVITDGKLRKSVEGPNLVIHSTGLTEKVKESSVSEKEAEQQVTDFVKSHVSAYTPLLAGNSVYVDFMFLKKYMPGLSSLFSHVIVDVSSINTLCHLWFPKDKKTPQKKNQHQIMDDIKENIAELKYYKERVFKSPKYKR
ncbi:oligoribonuclease-like [Rutidosis leptorrhynchoides]|uniref:oligoribonuclease-like n=1 Tax=Rutidosis leptorrhynchoides TaxID=125765 RepID=UPI003A98D4B7